MKDTVVGYLVAFGASGLSVVLLSCLVLICSYCKLHICRRPRIDSEKQANLSHEQQSLQTQHTKTDEKLTNDPGKPETNGPVPPSGNEVPPPPPPPPLPGEAQKTPEKPPVLETADNTGNCEKVEVDKNNSCDESKGNDRDDGSHSDSIDAGFVHMTHGVFAWRNVMLVAAVFTLFLNITPQIVSTYEHHTFCVPKCLAVKMKSAFVEKQVNVARVTQELKTVLCL